MSLYKKKHAQQHLKWQVNVVSTVSVMRENRAEMLALLDGYDNLLLAEWQPDNRNGEQRRILTLHKLGKEGT